MRSPFPALVLPLCVFAAASTATADIFVTSRGNASILVFADTATGNVAPLRRITGPATQITSGNLNGIAVDVVNGEIFVSLGTARILVFDILADGNVAPIRTISGPATGLAFTAGLAVDPINDELWAVNATNDGVAVFSRTASGNVPPLRFLSGSATGIAQPTGIFVDLEADEVYLTNESSSAPGVQVFPRTGNGNIAPVRRIIGSATTFTFAVGVFRNPFADEVLVNDLFSGRVLTFAGGANGNLPPIRTVSSGSFSRPGGLTLTNTGEMLVVDVFAGGVVGFDVAASGSSAPSREIRGPLTALSTPIYVVTTNSQFPGSVFQGVPAATIATRNAGTNPMSLSASGPAILGSTLTYQVDLTTTGNTEAVLVLTSDPATAILPDGSALLVGGTSFVALGPTAGPLATFALAVPRNLALAGFPLSAQAVHISGVGAPTFAFSNAVDLTAGL